MSRGSRYPFFASALARFYHEKGWPAQSSNALWKRCRFDYESLGRDPHPRSLFHMAENGHRLLPPDLLVHLQTIYGFRVLHHELFEAQNPAGVALKDSGLRAPKSGVTGGEPVTKPASGSRTVARGGLQPAPLRQSRPPRGKP